MLTTIRTTTTPAHPRSGPRPAPPRWERRSLAWVAAVQVALVAPGVAVGQSDPDPTPHSDARLIAETTALSPGTTATLGLWITLDPDWHTYWRNPGDSGSEAILEWRLPPSFEPGPVLWPAPERVPVPPLMSYAYHDAVLLATEITVPADLATETSVRIALHAEWLVCREVCLPAEADLELDLPVVAGPPDSDPRWLTLFAETRAALPDVGSGWTARAAETPTGYRLEVRPPPGWEGPEPGGDAYFFPSDPTVAEHALPQEPSWADGALRLDLVRSVYNTGPDALDGVLVLEASQGETAPGGGRVALALTAPVDPATVQGAAPSGAEMTLWLGMGFAFLGGLLLNLMPCVFPVVSLKVAGFLHHADGRPRSARIHGGAFAAGVVGSFLALAGVLMLARGAGAQIGWGFQLQSPPIVALLALLMFALGLVFAGVVEPGASLSRLGGIGADDTRYRGSFLTGVLAAVVATPCTAPFMGAAIGWALVRPAHEGMLVFACLGLGMATPYAVLSSWPSMLRRLPRPGAWMETLKQALSFPMFAVAAWLVWVFGLQTGVGGAASLLTAMILVAFAAWVLGTWPGPTLRPSARLLTRGVALAALATAGVATYRGTQGTAPEPGVEADAVWEAFGDGSVVERQRRSGRAVFVDFTAAWCISCQVNERVVLAAPDVRDAFAENDVALVKADWTRRDPTITRALASFGRSGVPLYVVYPADRSLGPELLPALLTPTIVLDALARAGARDLRETTRPESNPSTE